MVVFLHIKIYAWYTVSWALSSSAKLRAEMLVISFIVIGTIRQFLSLNLVYIALETKILVQRYVGEDTHCLLSGCRTTGT